MGKQGDKYQPSNGTEGMIFMDKFCGQCIHEHIPTEKYCKIVALTMGLDKKDKDYPNEWTYDEEGKPTCTKWKKWDWGDGGFGGDDWNEPPPPPYDPGPNQLMLFSVADDILNSEKNPKQVGKKSELVG